MVARQALAVAQLELAPVAVLAAVAVAGEEECVGDLATEAAGNVNELDQPDDGWLGKCERSLRTTSSRPPSTISALPSITRRSARRTGTIVNGSNEAFNAKTPHAYVSAAE